MKKVLLMIAALAMVSGLAACGSNNSTDSGKKDAKTASAPKVDTKKELVTFYMDLAKKINEKDVALNSYVKKASNPDATPADLPTAEDKASAGQAAADVASALNNYQIPGALKDQKAELESILKDYASSYQTKADELKKDKPDFKAADATFLQGDQKLGKVFEEAKLLPPSMTKEVN